MSILNYFRRKEGQSSPAGLPLAATPEVYRANDEVQQCIERSQLRGRSKRGKYIHYTPETRVELATYTSMFGSKSPVTYFSRRLKTAVNESTVRYMRRLYQDKVKASGDCNMQSLPHGLCGRPTKLAATLDAEVQQYLRNLRLAGGVVNRNITIAAATGIIKAKNPALLQENGGTLTLNRPWAESFLRRMHYVRRKGTKSSRSIPGDIDKIKQQFTDDVNKSRFQSCAGQEVMIPGELVVNWDQTGCKMVPITGWTLETEGSSQVGMKALDDKREITVLLCISLAGELLPTQVLYEGKTDQCHPDTEFPSDWDVYHSPNHWSNESTMLRYLDKIIIPYFEKKRKDLKLPVNYPGLAIFDLFAAHRCSSVLQKLTDHNIFVKFIPGGCTGELQPLDVKVNGLFKSEMKSRFNSWYADKVMEALQSGVDIADIQVDLRLTVLKPVHAKWLINTVASLSNKHDIIREAFVAAGIPQMPSK